jgi:hypothetical protein
MKTKPVLVTHKEWTDLTEVQRQFLREADDGGLRYLVLEDGRVCAWGVAVAGIFSMDVKVEKNAFDGFVVTLPCG